ALEVVGALAVVSSLSAILFSLEMIPCVLVSVTANHISAAECTRQPRTACLICTVRSPVGWIQVCSTYPPVRTMYLGYSRHLLRSMERLLTPAAPEVSR